MSAERVVSPAARSRAPLKAALLLALALVTIVFAYSAGRRAGATREVMAASPAEARRIAFVREEPCRGGWCQTLWVGKAREDAMKVASLAPQTERCEELAWAADGYRLGFVINGYELRVFDADTRKEVGKVNLFEPDGRPSSHVARGVTFSQNGAAVTFDDCPRWHSGCKSSMAAVR